MNYINKKCLVIIVLLISVLFFINESLCFSIKPSRIYKKVKSGEKVSGEYEISNDKKNPVRITIKKTVSSDWLILNKKKFDLKPGETKIVKYQIYVKNKNKKGELKSQISINQKDLNVKGLKDLKGSGASFQTRIKFPVYILIEGTEIIDYGIKKMDFKGNFSKKDKVITGNVSVSLDVENKGNVHFLCERRLMIYQVIEGNMAFIGEQKFDTSLMIFPDKKKNIKLEYNGRLKPGEYIVRLFCYFKFDEGLEINNIETLKKERCFNVTKKFIISKEGNFKLVE